MRAEEELEERRVQLWKEGRRKLEPVTFGAFAREWLDSYPDTKDLKRSTREGMSRSSQTTAGGT